MRRHPTDSSARLILRSHWLALGVLAWFTACSEDASVRTREEAPFTAQTVTPVPPPGCTGPLDTTVVTDFYEAVRCLFSSAAPPQRGVAEGVIERTRVAVVRGRVLDRAGAPIAGVTVTVLGEARYGTTETRADGHYDLAVNGGGPITLHMARPLFLSAQRQVQTEWRKFSVVDDVVLIAPGKVADPLALSALSAPAWVKGEPSTDASGTRTHSVLLKPGTRAEAELADGRKQPLDTVSLRITEFTVGASGPAAMPGQLPDTSAYTYAVDLSVVEAEALGARHVSFTPALTTYLDNFLAFPVGTLVPNGYYDETQGRWRAGDSGVVIKLLGKGRVDADGDGAADTDAQLTALGIDAVERAALAARYDKGQTLWRVPIAHFSAWDHNWPFGPPSDAKAPVASVSTPRSDGKGETRCGSIIGCEVQSLGELFPLTGTPYALHYQSDRTPGRSDAYELAIALSPTTVPPSLRRIELQVDILGKRTVQSFDPKPGQQTTFRWDGLDAYGRAPQGMQPADVRIGYVYDGAYQQTTRFGVAGGGQVVTGDRARSQVTLWSSWTGFVGALDQRGGAQLGGLSLNVHHLYDANSKTLYRGDGTTQSVDTFGDMIETVVGIGEEGFAPDGTSALTTKIHGPHGVVVAPDGTVFFSDEKNHRVRRIRRGGTVDTYAGNGQTTPLGDGGPALAAAIDQPLGLALAADGTLFVAQRGGSRGGLVRAIAPDGTIRTYAGGATPSANDGDGGPATGAVFREPHALALSRDGALYIADSTADRIRRIGPDGIISTVAGADANNRGQDGPATTIALSQPLGLAVGPEGSLYLTEVEGHRVRRITPDGFMRTLAGTGKPGFSGDGGPATEAQLREPHTVDVAPDGTVYLTDEGNRRVRRVRTDGVIDTVAGNGERAGRSEVGDQGPARAARFSMPRVVFVQRDGSLWIGDFDGGRIRRVRAALPGFGLGEVLIGSRDASEAYRFDSLGRHRETRDALTGAVLRSFDYDARGALAAVVERGQRVTRIERDVSGNPTAIVGPDGLQTTLRVGDGGRLSELVRPLGDATRLSYDAGGLLVKLERDRGAAADVTTFAYDAQGRLLRDTHPSGLVQALERKSLPAGHEVTRTLGSARREVFSMLRDDEGVVTRKHTSFDGLVTTTRSELAQTRVDGPLIDTLSTSGADPRFGPTSPITTRQEVRDGSRVALIEWQRLVSLTDSSNPLSLRSLEDVTKVNGRAHVLRYDGESRTLTRSSPAGRRAVLTLDELGRALSEQRGALEPVRYRYDERGLLVEVSQAARSSRYEYDARGLLERVTDPLGQSVVLKHDANARLLSTTYADGSSEQLSYDAADQLTSVTQAGKQVHTFALGAGGSVTAYQPPPGGDAASTPVSYGYDAQQELTQLGGEVAQNLSYDPASERLVSLQAGGQAVRFEYDASGRIVRIDDGAQQLALGYDGSAITSVVAKGVVQSELTRELDVYGWLTRETSGGIAIDYAYDADGLLLRAGEQTLTYDSGSGLVSSLQVGTLSEQLTYNAYGELIGSAVSSAAGPLYSRLETRDALGRVAGRTERIAGEEHAIAYDYDVRGRLLTVTRDGVVSERYGYDANGNRVRSERAGAVIEARYGAADQLLQAGEHSYRYDDSGRRVERTTASGSARYSYDPSGQLLRVTLPDGRSVEYVVDGIGNRVAKRIDGVLQRAFVFGAAGRVALELGPDGKTPSARFVYASRSQVPDLMLKGGRTYRLIADAVGSVRLVVDAADGRVAQRIDYDALGRVLHDSQPGFQPFGFAGGLYDSETGLVRLGARDYDAETGSWTARDPVLFRGGQSNLYQYSHGDPINYVDADGENPVAVIMFVFGMGMALEGDMAGSNNDGFAFVSSLLGLGTLRAGMCLLGTGPMGMNAAKAAGSAIGKGLRGAATGKMAAITQKVTALKVPQAEAAAATEAAVQALGLRTAMVAAGENTVISSVMMGASKPILLVRPNGSVVEALGDLGVQAGKFVVTNVRGL